MASWIHPSLLWFLPLALVPLIIHLITRVKQRVVRWGAMEFLFASQRKHRNWIMLKQILLLLARMAAVAIVVMMAAQPLLRSALSAWMSGSAIHHIIALDDSFSMAEQTPRGTVFEQAKSAIKVLAQAAAQQSSPQLITLIRFSQSKPDLWEVPVDSQLEPLLVKTLESWQPSDLAVGPSALAERLESLATPAPTEQRVVHVVSDFRARDWQDSAPLTSLTAREPWPQAQWQFVRCAGESTENLAIESLVAGPGLQAADVPLLMELTLHNYGQAARERVTVLVSEDGTARPAIEFETIPAGHSATRQFSVLFPTAGQHLLTAQIEGDVTLLPDNTRSTLVQLPDVVPVLLIDGEQQATDAQWLATALAPGGKVTTGIKPLVESPRYLREHSLHDFAAIILCNVDRVEAAERDALEAYVRQGGGLALFVGELTQPAELNATLYRDGQGLLPLPLTAPTQLLTAENEQLADLETYEHPIFRIFAGEQNAFLDAVKIQWYFAALRTWQASDQPGVSVLARLRNRAPLVLEKRFGAGRTITFLTKASPAATAVQGSWNNWGRDNLSYVVSMIELASYLTEGNRTHWDHVVGEPLEVAFSPNDFQPEVRFFAPHDEAGLAVMAESRGNQLVARLTNTSQAGIYQAQLTAADQSIQSRRYAMQVDPREGNLKLADPSEVSRQLGSLKHQWIEASELHVEHWERGGLALGDWLAYGLALLLIGEQLLGYALSYHPRLRGAN